jgi:hypothetical protein
VNSSLSGFIVSSGVSSAVVGGGEDGDGGVGMRGQKYNDIMINRTI